MARRYCVTYFGAFALIDPDGRDVTPKGSKAKGLLAMLCEVSEMRRGRRWIEGRLWSNRSSAQASGSLRQTLSEIKLAFRDDPQVFGADRLNVWLDPEFVETDLDALDDPTTLSRELLEGLEIRDVAFQEWKANFVARHGQAAQSVQSLQIMWRKTSRIGSARNGIPAMALICCPMPQIWKFAVTSPRTVESASSFCKFITARTGVSCFQATATLKAILPMRFQPALCRAWSILR